MPAEQDLRPTLREHFGHDTFRAGQEQVIHTLLEGRSALALFPTGAGKSLCYQLPALLLDGVTLVISPLIALMKDQVEMLRRRGIAAARLDSSLTEKEAATVLEDLKTGVLKLLYIAPEKLTSEAFVRRLKQARISLMAVDEAHCISEWGHNFRPEYLRLAAVARSLRIRRVLALTATATPEVAAQIREAFKIAKKDHVQTSFQRPNLAYQVVPCAARERLPRLLEELRGRVGCSVVYVTLQRTAEEVATYLLKHGVQALAYHAGLPDDQRHEAQERFMGGDAQVIVATIAFGMGIDKSDIRAVYHYNLPKSVENYLQETGRAGRDGQPADCITLACADDCTVLENFTYGDTPTPQALRSLTDHLLRQGEEFDVSMYELSHATDIRPLVIETVMTNLELAGVLSPLGSLYASYQYQLLQPLERVLSGHTAERRAFLTRLLSAGKKGRKWTTLELDAAAGELGETRDRVQKALTWLQEAGEIELKPSGVRKRFRLCEDTNLRDPAKTAQDLTQVFHQRESRDIERLNKVMELMGHTGCLTRWLTAYFGEKLAGDCGHCTSCRDKAEKGRASAVRQIPRAEARPISVEDAGQIRQLMDEEHAALRTSRQLARFLCGITSPAVTRARLTRHDAFGLLEGVAFQEVLMQTESM